MYRSMAETEPLSSQPGCVTSQASFFAAMGRVASEVTIPALACCMVIFDVSIDGPNPKDITALRVALLP